MPSPMYPRADLDTALIAIRASKPVKGDQPFRIAVWFHTIAAMAAHASPLKHPTLSGYKSALILRDRCGIEMPGVVESWWLASWLASPKPGENLFIGNECPNKTGLERSLNPTPAAADDSNNSIRPYGSAIATTRDTLNVAFNPDARIALIGGSDERDPEMSRKLAYRIKLVSLATIFIYDDAIAGETPIEIDVSDIGHGAIEALSIIPAREGAHKIKAPSNTAIPEPLKSHRATVARHGVNHVFDGYNPRRAVLKMTRPHPAALIEPKTLASMDTPPITAMPRLPQEAIEKGIISDAQFEAIAMAMTAHDKIMPTGERFGFLLADGTGVGKTNEEIGLVLANWNEGRRRSLYVTEKARHKMNVEKSMLMLGMPRRNLIDFTTCAASEPIVDRDGVLFITYTQLREMIDGEFVRLPQIIEWFGEKSDGLIVFDESHNLRNAISDDLGNWGGSPTSNQGAAGVELQQSLKNARILYASATGCSDPHNLGYMTRLRLWGEGTAFEDQKFFLSTIQKSGLSALEMVSAHLMACGLMISRTLSLEGVIVSTLTHALTPNEKKQWDSVANIFATLRAGLADAWGRAIEPWNRRQSSANVLMANSHGHRIPSEAVAHYESAVRRIAELMLVCMKTPIMIEDIKHTIQNGDAAIIQLMNTYESDVDDYSSTIASTIKNLVDQVIPLNAVHKLPSRARNMLSSYAPFTPIPGVLIPIPGNVEFRDYILALTADAPKLSSPLDQLMREIGVDHLAEITGRTTRRVFDSTTKRVSIETRSESATRADLAAFMGDRKQALVFSVAAGGASMDYHAANDVRNQRKRRHYILQAGVRADQAVQGIGRSHRANQKQPPEVILVSTDLPAERAYRSQTLSKIQKLGASSQGHRNAASGSFSMVDSYDNEHARAAFVQFLDNLASNQYADLTVQEFQSRTSLAIVDKTGQKVYMTDTLFFKRILTRLARTDIAMQEKAFAHIDAEIEQVIATSIKDRTFDSGPQALSDPIEIESEETLIRDPSTGAVIKSYKVNGIKLGRLTTFEEARNEADLYNVIGLPFRFAWSPETSRTWIQVCVATDDSGYPKTYRLIEPNQTVLVEATNDILYKAKALPYANMQYIEDLWEARCEALQDLANRPSVILCGALPMIFPFLTENGGVDRPIVADSTDGRRIMGIRVTPDQAKVIAMQAAPLISQTQKSTTHNAKHLLDEIANKKTIVLDNNWMINQQMSLNVNEIELHVPDSDRKTVSKAARNLYLRMVPLGNDIRMFFHPGANDQRKTLEALLTIAQVRSIDLTPDWSILTR